MVRMAPITARKVSEMPGSRSPPLSRETSEGLGAKYSTIQQLNRYNFTLGVYTTVSELKTTDLEITE